MKTHDFRQSLDSDSGNEGSDHGSNNNNNNNSGNSRKHDIFDFDEDLVDKSPHQLIADAESRSALDNDNVSTKLEEDIEGSVKKKDTDIENDLAPGETNSTIQQQDANSSSETEHHQQHVDFLDKWDDQQVQEIIEEKDKVGELLQLARFNTSLFYKASNKVR